MFRSVLASICIKDQFWFQWRKYLEYIQSEDTFDFYNAWKEIPHVIYEIILKDNGDTVIYRNAV